MEYLSIINSRYTTLLNASGVSILVAIFVCVVLMYLLYLVYLVRRNYHKQLYFLTLQFPEIEEEDEKRFIEKMQSVLSTLHKAVSTQTDKLFFEVFKTEEYITIQVGSNNQDILEQAKRLFSQLGSVQARMTQKDILETIQPLHVNGVAMIKDSYAISKDTQFFSTVVHMLASLKGDEQAGVQFIIRGVNKREALQKKVHGITMKARKYKRQLYEHEQTQLQMYQQKQRENMFKVKINVVGNSTLLVKNIGAAFQALNYENNLFHAYSETNKKSSYRFISPNILLDRIPYLQRSSTSDITTSELSYLFHPTSVIRSIYAPKQVKSIEATPEFMNEKKEAIMIGKAEDQEGIVKKVFFPIKNLARHLYVIGKTGRGKSTLLTSLISALVEKKRGNIFVFDPHGELLEDIVSITAEKEHLVYLSATDKEKIFTINPLFAFQKSDNEKAALREGLLDIIQQETQEQTGNTNTGGVTTFNRIKQMLDIGIAFADAYYAYLITRKGLTPDEAEKLVRERQLTLNDLPLLLLKEMDYLDMLQEIFRDDETQVGIYIAKLLENHTKQYMVAEAVQTRLEQLLHPSLQLVYEGNMLNLESTIQSDKTFLLPIPETVYGSRGARGLMQAIFFLLWLYKRQEGRERKETYMFIDEFQRAQINDIPEIISEGRKYKFSLVLSNQQLGQLKESIKDAIFGNIGTVVSFTVGAEEIGAKTLAPYFGNTISEHELIHLPPYTAYIKTEGDSHKPVVTFSFETVPMEKVKTKEGLEEISKRSLKTYGESREELKKKLHKKQANPLEYFLRD